MQRGEQTKGTEFVFPGEQRDVKASMMVFSYAENTDKGQGCLMATVPAEARESEEAKWLRERKCRPVASSSFPMLPSLFSKCSSEERTRPV